MKRAAVILCALIVATAALWKFPLFHIVPIESHEAARRLSAFNAAKFSQSFWDERLVKSLKQAADAGTVLAALRDDPQNAREQFGRKFGVSRSRLFLLQGTGTIVSIDKGGVGVALEEGAKESDIVLETGLLFGNTVRDVTGLLNASEFSNSQDFNKISAELNRIVETRVTTKLKEQASLNRQIRFTGCVEVSDATPVATPLKIIPLEVSID